MIKIKKTNFNEKRKGADFFIKILNFLALIGWTAIFGVLIILGKAQPRFVTVYDRHYNYTPKTSWNSDLTETIFYLLIFTFLISMIGVILNLLRHKRKEDKYYISLIVLSITSFLGIIIYLISN